MKPKCKTCGCNMVKRNGKYGQFWCCEYSTTIYNHGTKSIGKKTILYFEDDTCIDWFEEPVDLLGEY